MKVITRCVIDMATMETLEEESYEYEGDVAWCGGGSGGGGGGSGEVDFPGYMKNWHGDVLGHFSGKTVGDVMEDALENNPYTSAAAYDPTSEADKITSKADEQLTKVDEMDEIGEVVDFDKNILPKLEGGMRDINAVQSSAFAQARSNLWTDYAAKLASDKMKLRSDAVGQVIEANRMAIIAFKEQHDKDIEIDNKFEKWDLEVFKYGGNFLSSIQGTQTPQGTDEPSQTQSALAGAASGAAMGASVGGVPGAVAGGVLGAGASFL